MDHDELIRRNRELLDQWFAARYAELDAMKRRTPEQKKRDYDRQQAENLHAERCFRAYNGLG